MHHFCTLFDSNYLSRGLAMYRSLQRHCPSFHLYIFAFDDQSFRLLTTMNLRHVTVISLADFEDPELLRIKPTRSRGEYCWTCTSSTVYYCLTKFDLPRCTYIDADLLFYADPGVLLDEMAEQSVLITEHRYTPKYDQSKTNGIYCVQFIAFRNNADGLTALKWWRERCIEWCYNRLEEGKFGDQKYLDDWTERFHGIHVLRHLGGGVAPWNLQQYRIAKKGEGYDVADSSGLFVPMVFFHFHWVRFLAGHRVDLGCYDLSNTPVDSIYREYLRNILAINSELKQAFDFHIEPAQEPRLKRFKNIIFDLKRRVQGTYFVVDLKTLS
jgi:hypothetical protein